MLISNQGHRHGVFSKRPCSGLEARLAEEIGKRDKNESHLHLAEARVIECRNAAHAAARDGADDGELDKAEASLLAAQQRIESLSAGLSENRKEIADLERQVAEIADRKLHSETAAAIEKFARDVERAGAVFTEAAGEVAAISRAAAPVAIDAHPLVQYATAAASEVTPATSVVAQVLRSQAASTIGGAGPAALRVPVQPVRPPETVRRSIANLDSTKLPAISIPVALPNQTAGRLVDVEAPAHNKPAAEAELAVLPERRRATPRR